MRRRATLLAAVATVTVAVATAAGCGDESSTELPPTGGAGEVPADTKAVTLRGELASLVEEHVFLVTAATRTGARAGFDSELHKAAEKELEGSTTTLAKELAPLFDGDTRGTFRRQLTELVDLLLEYGRGQIEPDRSGAPLRAEIEERRQALVETLAAAGDATTAREISDHLDLTLDELLLALDRASTDWAGQIAHTSAAAQRSRGLAAVLAAAVAKADPNVEEHTGSETARIHADLRSLLEEDIHLSFAVTQLGLAKGFDGQVFTAASRQVDESATHLADRVVTIDELRGGAVEIPALETPPADATGSDSDDRARIPLRRAVRDTLRRHWQLLGLYAQEAGGDVPRLTTKEIEERLHAVTDVLAGVLAQQTAVPKETLLAPLDAADKELAKAIEALAKEDPKAYEHESRALDHMADAADVLTDGIVELQGR